MKVFPLNGKILESLTVFRKNPKTKRLTVSRYKLIRLDTMSKYVMSINGIPQITGGVVSDEERKEFFISGKTSLKPIPKGALK